MHSVDQDMPWSIVIKIFRPLRTEDFSSHRKQTHTKTDKLSYFISLNIWKTLLIKLSETNNNFSSNEFQQK